MRSSIKRTLNTYQPIFKLTPNEYYYNVLKEFKKKTGCGVIVNTSFNVRGEPILCTPKGAYNCFMRTEMDVLVLENCILHKEDQPEFQDSVTPETVGRRSHTE